MCMTLFIAARRPLPPVPWDAAAPGFHLQPVAESERAVLTQFRTAHVHFLGAHTGCSCGFTYGLREVRNAEDQREEDASRASVDALRRYLETAVAAQGEVELFASWEQDWTTPPRERLHVTPAWFGGDTFLLPEQVHVRVTGRAGA